MRDKFAAGAQAWPSAQLSRLASQPASRRQPKCDSQLVCLDRLEISKAACRQISNSRRRRRRRIVHAASKLQELLLVGQPRIVYLVAVTRSQRKKMQTEKLQRE